MKFSKMFYFLYKKIVLEKIIQFQFPNKRYFLFDNPKLSVYQVFYYFYTLKFFSYYFSTLKITILQIVIIIFTLFIISLVLMQKQIYNNILSFVLLFFSISFLLKYLNIFIFNYYNRLELKRVPFMPLVSKQLNFIKL